jgi:hypothetical protein
MERIVRIDIERGADAGEIIADLIMQRLLANGQLENELDKLDEILNLDPAERARRITQLRPSRIH